MYKFMFIFSYIPNASLIVKNKKSDHVIGLIYTYNYNDIDAIKLNKTYTISNHFYLFSFM